MRKKDPAGRWSGFIQGRMTKLCTSWKEMEGSSTREYTWSFISETLRLFYGKLRLVYRGGGQESGKTGRRTCAYLVLHQQENCTKPIEGTVVYILEVPAEKIIYFDEGKWDYVLNRIYLPKDEMDRQEYKQHLKDIGVVNGFEFFQGRYAGKYPQEEARIKESWLRVFEIDNWTIFNVCGNIWEIRKEWVKQIVHPGEAVV